MIFYYIRHGEPIYRPNSLTPLGIRQAEALAKRLALHGLDKIYSSTSNRAIMTAKPTCELLNMEPELLDFANENYAAEDFFMDNEDGTGRVWPFQNKKVVERFNSKDIRDLGDRWFDHPEFKKYDFQKGVERVYREMLKCKGLYSSGGRK